MTLSIFYYTKELDNIMFSSSKRDTVQNKETH